MIDSKYVEINRMNDHTWIDMDATEALIRKRKYENLVNLGVELQEINYEPWSTGSSSARFALSDRLEAFALVVYVEADTEIGKIRRKRRASGRRRHQHRKHYHRVASMEKGLCRRRELLVNFTELNWQDWIIAPSGYSAYQCQGECPQPLAGHFNATNHAIVQGLINSIHPNLVPAPCCIPVEMGPLAILYIDVESKVIIKSYPDMVVLSCGCR